MAQALHVFIINDDEDQEILVEHVFYGETREDCRAVKEEHLGSCSYFRAAEDDGRTSEEWEDLDDEDRPAVD